MRFDDRFTQRAKSALEFAHALAAELGHNYVGSEHILYGLSREGSGVAAKVLRGAGLEDKLIFDLIAKHIGAGTSGRSQPSDLSPRAKRIL